MNNLKFKAYVKRDRRIVDVDMIGRYCMDTNNYRHELRDVEVLQWTGRLDSEGNEIYEGHTVAIDIDREDGQNEEFFTVVFDHAGYYLQPHEANMFMHPPGLYAFGSSDERDWQIREPIVGWEFVPGGILATTGEEERMTAPASTTQGVSK